MKRYVYIFLTFLFILFSFACGNKAENNDKTPLTREDSQILSREDPNNTNSAPVNNDSFTENPNENDSLNGSNFESIVDHANKNNLTKEQIAQLEADAAANGYEIQWDDDGSMVIAQEDGNTIALNGNWPDNEYTKAVPEPNISITASSNDDSSFTVIFGSTTKEEIQDYANQLKNAGFTEDANTQDQAIEGMDIFLYSAHNSDGLYIELMYTGAQNVLTISK